MICKKFSVYVEEMNVGTFKNSTRSKTFSLKKKWYNSLRHTENDGKYLNISVQFWEVLINDVTTNPLGKPQVNRKVGVGPENRNNKFFLCSFEAQHVPGS